MQTVSGLPLGRTFRRCLMSARIAALVSLLGGMAAMPTWADAASLRCPAEKIDAGKDATPAEVAKMEALWKDLHGSGAGGGDGPLGCPIGTPTVVADPKIEWAGLQQQFQRGWVLVGRGASNGGDVALMRGVDEWTIWFTGLQAIVLPTVVGTSTTQVRPAAWPRGGSVFVTQIPGSDPTISLLRCPTNQQFSQSSISMNGCKRLLPDLMTPPDRPFDPAARLDELLVVPDVAGKSKRIGAVLADWLPCHVRPPMRDEVGEAAFSHVLLMLRRSTPCPLTGRSPRSDAILWPR